MDTEAKKTYGSGTRLSTLSGLVTETNNNKQLLVNINLQNKLALPVITVRYCIASTFLKALAQGAVHA
jgi:hypothetical protein